MVLGMHRSGTSVLTRTLNFLGADVGEHLLPAEEGINAKGYWEHQTLVSINEALLSELGRKWYDFRPLPEAWCKQPGIHPLMDRAQRFLDTAFNASTLAVIKDPRLCILLPFWIEAAIRTGWKARVVLALRAPWEVAASLCHRDPLSKTSAYLLWLRYSSESELQSRELPRATVDYSTLLNNWQEVLPQLGNDLGISWPVPLEKIAAELEKEIDPRMQHQRSHFHGDEMLVASLAGKVYQQLREAQSVPEDIWQEFENIFKQCEGLSAGLAASNERLVEINNELHSLGEKHHQALKVIAEKDEQLSALSQELAHAESIVQERDQHLSRLAGELEYANSIVGERDQQLQQLAKEFEHADQVVKQRDQEITQRDQQLQAVTAELAISNTERAHLQKIRTHLAVRIIVKLFSLDKK